MCGPGSLQKLQVEEERKFLTSYRERTMVKKLDEATRKLTMFEPLLGAK
jgi:uncharacterized protein YueI